MTQEKVFKPMPGWTPLAITVVLIVAAPVGIVSGAVAESGVLVFLGVVSAIGIPLMLLALGHALGGFRLAGARRVVALGVLRLGLGFGAALGAAWLLGLEGLARQVLLLQGAMPAAVFNYLLAERYQRDPQDVAGVVLVSSAISVVTIPLVISWLLL